MFTCFIRYYVDPDKLSEFKEYARAWIFLIQKYGGIHHGYFIPGIEADDMPSAALAFPVWAPKGLQTSRLRYLAFLVKKHTNNTVCRSPMTTSVRPQRRDSRRQNAFQVTSGRSLFLFLNRVTLRRLPPLKQSAGTSGACCRWSGHARQPQLPGDRRHRLSQKRRHTGKGRSNGKPRSDPPNTTL